MNDIVRTIKLCGLRLRSDTLKPVRREADWTKVKALIGPGTASVITRALAHRAGAQVIPGLRTHHGHVHDGALMVLYLAGCSPSYHMVVVDDQLVAATSGPLAHMILGNEYLVDNRALFDRNDELFVCPLPLSKPTPTKHATAKTSGVTSQRTSPKKLSRRSK